MPPTYTWSRHRVHRPRRRPSLRTADLRLSPRQLWLIGANSTKPETELGCLEVWRWSMKEEAASLKGHACMAEEHLLIRTASNGGNCER
jgi:hypothetical protein